MRFLPLIWAALWRKPVRTTLTTLALIAAFTLFGIMEGINAGLVVLRDIGRAENLMVSPRFNAPIPMAYKEQIAQIAGVKRVVATVFLGGTVNGDPKRQALMVFAEEGYFDFTGEYNPTPTQLAELREKRNAVIITPLAAEQWGVKLGDRLVLNSTPKSDGTRDWGFDVIAIVDYPNMPKVQAIAFGNFAYVNEERAQGRDTVTQFLAALDDPDQSVAVQKAIEDRFLNSAAPVRTQNEAKTLEQVYDDNNLPEITRAIVLSTLFALLLLTSNTIMQSFRERIPELGTLKAIGFTDRQVFALVISEAVMQCVTGAVIGLAIAPAIMPYAKDILKGQGTALMTVSWSVVVLGLLAAAAVAIISAAVPALRAVRLSIVGALAER